MTIFELLKSISAAFGQDVTVPTSQGGDQTLGGVLFDEHHFVSVAADAAASTTTANTKIFVNALPCHVRVNLAGVNADANVANSATDYATYSFLADDGADGTPVVFASLVTNAAAGALVRDVTKQFTISNTTAALVPPGGCVYRSVAKAGSGVQLPIHTAIIRVRRCSSTE
jgi:hypothetical protein